MDLPTLTRFDPNNEH